MGHKGKRYSNENKLNYTKIFALFIFILVLFMVILGIKKMLTTKTSSTGRISTINYFPVYTNSKWGVIDSNGDVLIEPQYEEMIVIPNSSKPYFVCTFDVDYATGTYKTKVVNEKNELVYSEYENITFMDYFEDESIKYLDNILKVQNNDKYGLISINGNKILDCDYEEISILNGVSNSLLIKKDGLLGLSDYNGNIIIEPKYKDIQAIGNNYKNGYITISTDNLYGIVDFNSNIIFDNKFLDIKNIYSANKYAVKIENKYKVINKTEKVLLDMEFENIRDISNNEIIYLNKGKYGVITIDGTIKIQPKYEDVKFLDSNTYIIKQNGKYGVINSEDKMVIENKYADIDYSSSAGIIVAKVSDKEYELYDKTSLTLKVKVNEVKFKDKYIEVKINNVIKYYNFKFEEKDVKSVLINNTLFSDKKENKYGFIDNESNLIVDYKYDDVTEFNEFGFAGVKLNGLWGVIGLDGKEIVSPRYNLDNNKTINFINKWHIGIDNTYYTDI